MDKSGWWAGLIYYAKVMTQIKLHRCAGFPCNVISTISYDLAPVDMQDYYFNGQKIQLLLPLALNALI